MKHSGSITHYYESWNDYQSTAKEVAKHRLNYYQTFGYHGVSLLWPCSPLLQIAKHRHTALYVAAVEANLPCFNRMDNHLWSSRVQIRTPWVHHQVAQSNKSNSSKLSTGCDESSAGNNEESKNEAMK